ncbi:GTP-binding protein [Cellulomonas sp. PhB143]|uniref:GTP-binding protein n=1 Tax=Cellulomonas sp. PhB143 TaxID=2485186 RepID=UPI000F473E2C|nr:GTP-binding protein [Cellulomonas sp. PhB143]ROS77044.1 50S ribosome-binding GTPase [Cellulomonas sp. PhB143]
MTTDDRDLRGRTEDLATALDLAADRVPADVEATVRAAITGVRERLDLGVDHTVVALAGGTGSGKSSLFNRLSRLDFADVGVKRPTTAQITACAWSTRATPLLDWLRVIPERRITRGHELDAADEDALAGLVLLDLPDHDSIEPAHRVVVDRVLPYVDLLVWVVDPQKYADDSLHTEYLSRSVGYEASMVVAVNQIDTVPEGRREALVADLERLLEEDGLRGVHVTTVSAATGEGVDAMVDLLEQAVDRRSVAASRVAGELDGAGALLLSQTPADAPWSTTSAVEAEVDALAAATGLESVGAQVENAVRHGYGRPAFEPPQADAVALSRGRWLARAGKGLRPGWRAALEADVASRPDVTDALTGELGKVRLDTRPPAAGRPMRVVALVALALGIVAGVLAVLGGGSVLALSSGAETAAAVAAAVLVVAGLVLLLLAVRLRRSTARQRRRAVVAAGRAAIERVVDRCYGEPTRTLLAEHRQVRELAQAAREKGSLAPLTGAVPVSTAAATGAASTGSPAGGDVPEAAPTS